MLPIQPSENLHQKYPTMQSVKINSPKDVPEEECGDVVALVGQISGGIFDGGPIIRTFWQPSEEELAALNAGAVIELDFYDVGMPMTAMNVEYP